ncbi:MAG: T9SS type A sorting domain-containing protein, partial [Bacteroidales bacterium]|nr:T9SS type A sorting domain-containing protein [Bacteroidales bacterium]
DLVTCANAEEMWINEGWAVFSEFIFEEIIYGDNAAKSYIRDKHADVLKKAHFDDGAFYPVCNVPHDVTYGTTVYDKGAMVVHTMRHYMGDSLFFDAVHQYTDTYQFDNITCAEMRDFFGTVSGVDLNDFFDAWVFREGFPHFSVDSFASVQNGSNYDVTVYMKQKLYGCSQYANSNKIELSFMNNQWQEYNVIIEFSGQTGSQTISVPFNPDFIICDKYEKTADAIISYDDYRNTTGSIAYADAFASIDITQYVDSTYFRVEHHWVAPDAVKTNPNIYRISPNHYWSIDGLIPTGTNFTPQFDYNRIATTSTGMIDTDFLSTSTSVDSLVLAYRRDASDDWAIVPFTKYGNFNIGKIKTINGQAGEYCLAIGEPGQAAIEEPIDAMNGIDVFPNPSAAFSIEINDNSIVEITIVDMQGRTVFRQNIEEGSKTIMWFPESSAAQHFIVYAFDTNGDMKGIQKILFTP